MHHIKPIGESKLKSESENAQFGSKLVNFLSRVTLKFDWWPWKTIGHLLYTTSSFVHHFKAMGEFKLELQSGNSQFESKSAIFLSHVSLKFDGWPWKTIGHLFYVASSFVHHFIAICEFKLETSKSMFFVLCDLEILQMTLKNNRAPLLCYLSFMHRFIAIGEFKLELQSGNSQFGLKKTMIFFSCVTLKFDGWPWKTIGHLS